MNKTLQALINVSQDLADLGEIHAETLRQIPLGIAAGKQEAANVAALVKALEDTATLSYELMERAARIDAKLAAVGGNPAPDCELGEIARLRGQLSKNRVSIANLNS